ncbi:MAG: GAF domain-containing protein [Chloroflexi bacterium]|nr:GAF domain-containing protein [Chloroflexota bacterium]
MSRFLRILNPISWPIWLKLTALVTTVMVLVTLILVLVALNLRTVDNQNLRSFLEGEAADQREAIIEALNIARTTLNNFATDAARRDSLVSALRDSGENSAALQALTQTLQAALVDVNYYSSVRLLDLDGLLIAGAGRGIPLRLGDDRLQNESRSEAFQAAETTRVRNRTQDLIVSELGVPQIYVVQVILDENNLAAGYLIATINSADVIIPLLRGHGTFVPTFSYLIRRSSSDTIIFAAANERPRAQDSAQSDPVRRALDGLRERGSVEDYSYESEIEEMDENGRLVSQLRTRSVIGYYIDISAESRLALIVEIPADSTYFPTLTTLFTGNYVFVLAIAMPVLALLLVLLFNQFFVTPLQNVRQALRAMSKGNFNEPVEAVARSDEFGQLAIAFVEMREQVQALIARLEQRIAARSRDIQATQEISRFAATQRDIQILMNRVVELIVQYFPNIYHAQIFLLDPDNRYAVLRSSTGEPGRKLLERGHRLQVGSLSVIGRVTEQGQYIVARDTATSDVHRRNEFLPDTRSELAIPLRIGEKIIGALDVQSKKPDAFPEDEINVLQTMADQIAVAIENATLYQESLRSLAEIERSKRQQTQRDWEEYMQMERVREMSSEYGTKTPLDISELRRQAILHQRTMIGRPTERGTIAIAVPVTLRGQVLGAAEWELPLADFGEDKVLLAQELVNRLAVSMENARLFQQSQLATERERLVNTISAKLTSKQDINDILQTALREVGQALRAPEVSIRMNWSETKRPTAPAPEDTSYVEVRAHPNGVPDKPTEE